MNRNKSAALPETVQSGLIPKLVEYPQEIWDFLRNQKGLFVPDGRFSDMFFAKNRLPFSFVRGISMSAKKKLLIMLLKEMISFDSTMARNFRDCAYTEEDREVLADVAAMLDEPEARELENSSKQLVDKIQD